MKLTPEQIDQLVKITSTRPYHGIKPWIWQITKPWLVDDARFSHERLAQLEHFKISIDHAFMAHVISEDYYKEKCNVYTRVKSYLIVLNRICLEILETKNVALFNWWIRATAPQQPPENTSIMTG